MKLITLDPYNSKHRSIIDKSSKKNNFKHIMSVCSICNKEEYEEIRSKKNEILDCLLNVENDEIQNYCIFNGTKDNRLIQMGIESLTDKKFLEESMNYAFQVLNAHTITIFLDGDNSNLERMGFESLGQENGITTYIKEKEINIEMEKVR